MEILNDFNTSVRKAFDEIDPKWESYEGIVVCGTHSPHDVEEMIEKIRGARESGLPFLGICMGMELMLIEFARNVLKLENANTTEVDPVTPYPIFIQLPELRVGLREVCGRQESHWHNWAFNNRYRTMFEGADLWATYSGDIMEEVGYKNGFYFGCQYHPEYQNSFDSPHPVLKKFLVYAKNQKKM